jgi:anion transporter
MNKLDSLRKNRTVLSFLLAVALAVLVLFLPLDLAVEEQRILAIVVLMIVLFITESMALALAGLLGCVSFYAFAGVSFPEAFAGFSESTMWFVLGALMIGAMATKSRIPNRIAYHMLKLVGDSYPRILLGLIVLDFALTMIIPSGSARVVVLCTIAIGLIDSYGIDHKSNIAKGMILILTYCATIFDKTILAGAASILARDVIQQTSGLTIGWSRWFIAYAPIDLLTMLVLWFVTLRLFPPEVKHLGDNKKANFAAEKLKELGPMTFADYRVVLLLLVAMLLWATDFLHGIPAAKVCLVVGLLGFVPRLGVLGRDDFAKLNFPIVIFVGAALSMGAVLTDTSILTKASAVIFEWLTPFLGSTGLLSALLYLVANVFHIFLGSEVALLGVTMPVVMEFATQHALHPETIGMTWTFAAGGKLFIYQSAVLALGYAFGTFTTKDLFRMGLWIILIEGVFISLIVPLYWNLIGFSYYL